MTGLIRVAVRFFSGVPHPHLLGVCCPNRLLLAQTRATASPLCPTRQWLPRGKSLNGSLCLVEERFTQDAALRGFRKNAVESSHGSRYDSRPVKSQRWNYGHVA